MRSLLLKSSLVVLVILATGTGLTLAAASSEPGMFLYPLKQTTQRVTGAVPSAPAPATREIDESEAGLEATGPATAAASEEPAIDETPSPVMATPTPDEPEATQAPTLEPATPTPASTATPARAVDAIIATPTEAGTSPDEADNTGDSPDGGQFDEGRDDDPGQGDTSDDAPDGDNQNQDGAHDSSPGDADQSDNTSDNGDDGSDGDQSDDDSQDDPGDDTSDDSGDEDDGSSHDSNDR